MVKKSCAICKTRYEEKGAGKTCSEECQFILHKRNLKKNKAKRKEYNSRPDIKAKRYAYNEKYRQRPEVKERLKEMARIRKGYARLTCSECGIGVNPKRKKTPVKVEGKTLCNACLKELYPEKAYKKRKPRSRKTKGQKHRRKILEKK